MRDSDFVQGIPFLSGYSTVDDYVENAKKWFSPINRRRMESLDNDLDCPPVKRKN